MSGINWSDEELELIESLFYDTNFVPDNQYESNLVKSILEKIDGALNG